VWLWLWLCLWLWLRLCGRVFYVLALTYRVV